MLQHIKQFISDAESLIELHGDTWMALFTAFILWRILKGPVLSPSEAATYASAIGAFAYSNRGGPKGA